MADQLPSPAPLIRFSVFELDPGTGELRKAGRRIALQDHSLRILVALLEHPGAVVTRDRLRGLLWPADTFVDFERGLNTAVKRLRDALGDDAETPRFIETLPRRGYRLITPVERVEVDATGHAGTVRPRPGRLTGLQLAGLISVVVALVALALATAARRSGAGPGAVVHLVANIAPADQLLSAEGLDRVPTIGFGRPSRTAIAISPDGSQLVFSGRRGDSQMLFVRSLATAHAAPLAGTEGGDSPFYSPDGRWIGFWSHGGIRKISASGGPVLTVAGLAPEPRPPSAHAVSDPPLFGASWGSDDVIVFGVGTGALWQVPANGGTPEALTRLQEGEVSHRLPHVLPGGNAVLFTAKKRRFGDWQRATIEAYVRATGERKLLVDGAADPRYLPTGHLLFVRSGALLAVPFDAERLVVTGDTVGLIDSVMQAAAVGTNARIDTGAAQFAVSNTGTLAYVPGGMYPSLDGKLVWVDRRGGIEPLGIKNRAVVGTMPRVSPDGRHIVLGACSDNVQLCDLWNYDLARGQLTRLTFGVGARASVWTDDGDRLAFASDMQGPTRIFSVAADGDETGAPAAFVDAGTDDAVPAVWSAAADALIFTRRAPSRHWDIWAVAPLSGRAPPRAVAATPFDEINPALSPDGRWLAYVSTDSGRREVYIQPFPGPGPKRKVSAYEGDDPVWARNGHELFYIEGGSRKGRMMSVRIRAEPVLAIDPASALFDVSRGTTGRSFEFSFPTRGHDIAPDGRFLMVLKDEPPSPQPVNQIQIVLNWHQDVKAKVPIRRP